jgi:hypothetical protein
MVLYVEVGQSITLYPILYPILIPRNIPYFILFFPYHISSANAGFYTHFRPRGKGAILIGGKGRQAEAGEDWERGGALGSRGQPLRPSLALYVTSVGLCHTIRPSASVIRYVHRWPLSNR